MHISSRNAKILGETNFRTREIPRSGSKAEDGGEERKKERLNKGENNGQATHGARKHAWRTQAAWANKYFIYIQLLSWPPVMNVVTFVSDKLDKCKDFDKETSQGEDVTNDLRVRFLNHRKSLQ